MALRANHEQILMRLLTDLTTDLLPEHKQQLPRACRTDIIHLVLSSAAAPACTPIRNEQNRTRAFPLAPGTRQWHVTSQFSGWHGPSRLSWMCYIDDCNHIDHAHVFCCPSGFINSSCTSPACEDSRCVDAMDISMGIQWGQQRHAAPLERHARRDTALVWRVAGPTRHTCAGRGWGLAHVAGYVLQASAL